MASQRMSILRIHNPLATKSDSSFFPECFPPQPPPPEGLDVFSLTIRSMAQSFDAHSEPCCPARHMGACGQRSTSGVRMCTLTRSKSPDDSCVCYSWTRAALDASIHIYRVPVMRNFITATRTSWECSKNEMNSYIRTAPNT